jgi:hypothetical protein
MISQYLLAALQWLYAKTIYSGRSKEIYPSIIKILEHHAGENME